jgi:hypothetical protein
MKWAGAEANSQLGNDKRPPIVRFGFFERALGSATRRRIPSDVVEATEYGSHYPRGRECGRSGSIWSSC